MNLPIREKVGAYIIRRNQLGTNELLVFRHLDYPDVAPQVPGGGIDPGEAVETALHREIWEESGLQNLPIVRKLGISEQIWHGSKPYVLRRHCFLLNAPNTLPDAWLHQVQGNGDDAGLRFAYSWEPPTLLLPGDLGYFLRPKNIPELFPGAVKLA